MVVITSRDGNGYLYNILFILSLLVSICHCHVHQHSDANLQNHAATGSHEAATHLPPLQERHAETAMSPEDDWTDMSVKHQRSASRDLESVITKQKREDYSCDEHNPCPNNACCAKSGYCGYGESSCGDGKSPNDVCWSNCDAKAECGKDALFPGQTCPLNVCCSEFGFCGTADDFCGAGCQSGCDKPSSGSSKGDVQQRVIGYYENWARDRTCSGMNYHNIPVTSITHLHYSFGYIKPDLTVIPMEGLDDSSITQFTALKEKNAALKIIVAIGGWTFNDNHTVWQPVFSKMVSSKQNRNKFITNLFDFLEEYAFDGVDFDWEYPGAGDRGGHDDDGINYTQFLSELKDAIKKEGKDYTVSFTAPSSYWYLQHFDLTMMMDVVDYCNLMTYDLHGVWDSDNPIGDVVLAHTNLTEIKSALDLFWRNGVDPSKVNLGLGFYGRSFTLKDSKCWKPGCHFKSGGAKGACTDNSGTLSYKEITQIIDKHKIDPYYDKKDAVKYITWDNNQWVSYDDQETFQQKIKYANSVGLGGLLIWALDLDTDNLDALKGVLHPKKIGSYGKSLSDKSYWENAATGQCRVTDCGGKCNAAEISVSTQPCGGAAFATFRSTEDDSTLCCPISGAPDPKDCQWRGGAPACNGHCQPGEVQMETNKWGDGKYCSSGDKVYCCEVPDAEKLLTQCKWQPPLNKCEDFDQIQYTWDKSTPYFDKTPFCCDKDMDLKNCAWHGSGSCEDNQCPSDQIIIAESYTGEGKDCHAFKPSRQRVYCCDPPDGKSPWLPVKLDYLFEHPPTGDDLDVDVQLDVDPSFGGKVKGGVDDPEKAAFGFFVMASPEALQVSLNKRDGSHWEVFSCAATKDEGPQRLKMVCSQEDIANSNCNKIHLGHGVPGTIVELPDNCGAGKFAVAISMELAEDQNLPKHPEKRDDLAHKPAIYDLHFDYDFHRVPRDLGDTQFRIDFSNQEGYWDGVVDKAADKRRKRKRGLEDLHGDHKRWLEDAWREDYHESGLSKEELHKRWFGEDVVAWLKNLVSVASGAPLVDHFVKEKLDVILYDQKMSCQVGGVDIFAALNMRAGLDIEVDTSFGFSLISKLSLPLDLSNAHVYFRNRGEVVAEFTLEALASASFSSGDIELFGLENFGATFRVPGIVTIGPNLQLFGSLDGEVSLSGKMVSQVKVASWDLRQTYPTANDDYDPKTLEAVNPNNTKMVGEPSFNYSVSAIGAISAHLKPVATFGIDFDSKWDVANCKVSLTVDGSVTFHAEGSVTNSASSFCYGIDAGVEVYASVDAPRAFGWDLSVPKFDLFPLKSKSIYGPKCPVQSRSLPESDELYGGPAQVEHSLMGRDEMELFPSYDSDFSNIGKRKTTTVGPLLSSLSCLICPSESDENQGECPSCEESNAAKRSLGKRQEACPIDSDLLYDDIEATCSGSLESKRDFGDNTDIDLMELYDNNANLSLIDPSLHSFDKRTSKTLSWGGGTLTFNTYTSCDTNPAVSKWWTFKSTVNCDFGVEKKSTQTTAEQASYVTEHVYEIQLIGRFFDFLTTLKTPTGGTPSGGNRAKWKPMTKAQVFKLLVGSTGSATKVKGKTTMQGIADSLASNVNRADFALCHKAINTAKTFLFRNQVWNSDAVGTASDTKYNIKKRAAVFSYMKAGAIWTMMTRPSVNIEKVLADFDTAYAKANPKSVNPTNFSLRQAYCYWIDLWLASNEKKAAAYSTSAFVKLVKKYPKEKNWGRANMQGSGGASSASMKFPRSGGSSTYGVWDPKLGACDGK